MSGREIVLSGYGLSLKKEGQRLVVKQEGKAVFEAPASEVGGVWVMTDAASVTAEAVQTVVENGAALSFFDWRGTPYAFVLPPVSYADALLRAAQLDAARSEKGLRIAVAFLDGKLRNQAATIKYFAKTRKQAQPDLHGELTAKAGRISELAQRLQQVEGASGQDARAKLMGIESEGAAVYWSGVARLLPEELKYPGRIKRGASDPVNTGLNYGYGILYSKVLTQICCVGLDPYVGFLHAWRKGHAALLFDFVEEFRQYFVDRPVLGWFLKGGRLKTTDGRLTRESRDKLAGLILKRFSAKVKYEGAKVAAESVILQEARELVAEVKGGPEHTAFIWPW